MHLVVHQVVQLQVMHVADGGGTLEAVARAAIVQIGLRAGRRQALALGDVIRVCNLQHVLDFFFRSTVEHWRCV